MSAVPVADPNLRKKELNLMTDEIPSPLKPIGFEPEDYELVSVDEGHYVKPFDGMAA
jgi:glutathione transport system ATP-binding protein